MGAASRLFWLPEIFFVRFCSENGISELTTPDLQSAWREGHNPAPAGPPSSDAEQWIAQARSGCGNSLGRLAERCRQYLLLVANRELDDGLRSKVGASDLVQETLLTVQQSFDRFEGTSEVDLRRWVRQILLNKIAQTKRFYGQSQKRDIHREQPPTDDAQEARDWLGLVDQAATPYRKAIADEQTAAIERAIECLPEHYRQVITLRCFDRQSFVEIGRSLQISDDAARKLWCRAIDRLRREWEASDESR
jgi:RNA polymerase sigma-70 factor (ECF subfamily)